VAILYYVGATIPALREVIRPIYWVLLGIVLFTTLRWLRARSADRRGSDRRRKDRRENPES
jgi:hypothetical protein